MLKDMKMAERSRSKKALQPTAVLARGAKSKEDGSPAPNAPGWFNPDYLNPVVIPANDSDADKASPAPPCPARKASSECKKLCSPRQNPVEAGGCKSKRQRHRSYKCRRSSSSWGPRTAQHCNWPQSLDDLIPRDPHRISDSEANILIAASLSKKQLKSNKKKDMAGASPRKQHSNDSIPNDNPPPPGKPMDHRQRTSPPNTSTKSVTPPSTRTSPVADCSGLFPSLKSSPTTGGGDRRKSGASIRLLSTKLSHTNLPTCANQSVKIAHKFSDTKLLNFSDPTKLARQLTAVIPKEKMAMNAGGQNGGDGKSLIETPEINPFKPTPFFEAIESPVVLENLEIKKFNVSTPFFERKSSLESLDANKEVLATDSGQLLDKSDGDHQEVTVPTTSNNKMAVEPTTVSTKMTTEPKTLNTKMATEQATNPARQSPRKFRDRTPRGIEDAMLKSPGRSPCQALSKLSSGQKSKALDLIPSSSGRKVESSHEKPASESLSSTTIILSSTTTTILNTTLVVQQQSKATTCDSCGKAVQVTNVQSMPPSARQSANSTGTVANFQDIPSAMPQDIPSGPSSQLDGFAKESASKSQLDKSPKAEHNKAAFIHEDDQLLHKDAPMKDEEEEEAKNKLVWVPTSFFKRINKNVNGALVGPSSSSTSLERTPDLISGGAIKCKSEESQASVDSNSTFVLHAGESGSMESTGPGPSSSDTAIQLGETQYFLPLITHDEEKFFGCIRPVRRGDSRRELAPPQFVKANKSRTTWKSIGCQGGGGVTNTRITTCAATAVLTSSTRSFSTTRRRKGPRILKLLAPPITSSGSPISVGSNGSNSAQAGILLLPAGPQEFPKESPAKCSNNDNAELSKFQLDPIFAFRIPSFELIPLQRIEEEDELRDSSLEESQRDDWGRCEGSWSIIDLITPSASTELRVREADEVLLDLSEYRKPGSPPFLHNLAQYYDAHHVTEVCSTQPEQESSRSNKFTTSVIPQASASDSTNPSGWSNSSSSSSTSYYNSQARLKCKNSKSRRPKWKLSRFSHHVCLRKVTFSRHFRSLFPSCCSSSSSKPKPSSINRDRSSSSIIQLY